MSSLTLHPIGYIRAAAASQKFHALHQPAESGAERSVLEINDDPRLLAALKDLSGFSRIWLIWWFHRNSTWRSEVLPPRGPEQRRGVFATRSPYRPNPLGMTPVQLLGVEGRRLLLGPCDAIDGTPVFDIRPYIPAYDAFPDERAGWTAEVEAAYALPPPFTVRYGDRAHAQAEWLRTQWQIDFRPRLEALLGRDPSPHRTRRIKRTRIDCGAWRAFFTVVEHTVTITSLATGYPPRFLHDATYDAVPDGDAQRAFLRAWPDGEQAL